jgi:hypothetical protein
MILEILFVFLRDNLRQVLNSVHYQHLFISHCDTTYRSENGL